MPDTNPPPPHLRAHAAPAADAPKRDAAANHDEAGAAKTRKSRSRKIHVGVMIASLAAGSATTVTLLDSWQKVLVDLGLRKDDAFVLAEQSAKGELLRDMTKLVALRDFWLVRYVGPLADGYPKEDLDDAWKHYNESVVTWNENFIVSDLLTGKYFGVEAKRQIEDISWLLHRLNTCVNKIHYRALYESHDPACHFDGGDGGTQDQNIAALTKTVGVMDKQFATFLDTVSK